MDFSIVTDANFSSFGIEATHIDFDTQEETVVTVIKKAPQDTISLGLDRKIVQKFMVDVRTSEVSVLARRDRFNIDDILYEVIGTPEKDTQGLVWSAMLDLYNG